MTFLFSTIVLASVMTAATPLKKMFISAQQYSDSLQIESEKTEQSGERRSQARGALWPTLETTGQYVRQHTPASAPTSFNANQYSAKIGATQPLFRGLGEYAGLSTTAAADEAQRALYAHFRVTLYADVASSYFSVLSAEQDKLNYQKLLDLTRQRVSELKQRQGIGKSRKGEVLSAQALLATLQAQKQSIDANVTIARNELSKFVGRTVNDQLVEETVSIPQKLPPLEQFTSRVELRKDILAQVQLTEAARSSIGIARSGHLPSLDANANYYLKRSGSLVDSKWDAGVFLTIPLFQGGVIQSQVDEAASQYRESQLLLAKKRKDALLEITSVYEQFLASQAQFVGLSEATKISEASYLEQKKDYRFGLVSSLEVLQALNSFQEAKRSFDRSKYQLQTLWVQLHTSVGEIPGESQ